MNAHFKSEASKASSSKKAYQTPKLATHGSIEKLTLHDYKVGGYSDMHCHHDNGGGIYNIF